MTMTDLRPLEHLAAHLDRVRWHHGGKAFTALCPAHDDHDPSLDVTEGLDGRALVICRSRRCPPDRIVRAVGLELRDLFAAERWTSATPQPQPKHDHRKQLRREWRITAEVTHVRIDYPDCLLRDGKPCRDFHWQRNGKAGLGGLPLAQLPLYGTDDMAALPDGALVVVVEGEQPADALRASGIPAVATFGKDHKPAPDVLRPLSRFELVLWPDADLDDGGIRHMADMAQRLQGVARSVRRFLWSDAPPKGDAADYLKLYPDAAALRGELEQLPHFTSNPEPLPLEVKSPRKWSAREVLAAAPPDGTQRQSLPLLGRSGYFIRGWSHIVSAYPKTGKTELLATCVQDWLTAGVTVHWITEESQAVWQDRMSRWDGEPDGLFLTFGLGEKSDALLRLAVEGKEDVVIVDTIRNLLGLDEGDNTAISRGLSPWVARLAGKTLILVHHDRKAGGEHGHSIAGGGAFLGVVDRALEIRHDTSERNRRVITVYSRIQPADDLLYELRDGKLVALGDPAELELAAVGDRLSRLLTADWQATKALQQALPEPRPSVEQVRLALTALALTGKAERDPSIGEKAQGKTVRWRASSVHFQPSLSLVGGGADAGEV